MNEISMPIGFGWYSREEWLRLLEVAADREKLDDSYEDWVEGAEKGIGELAVAGANVQKVNVDVEKLVKWCEARGRPVDGSTRAEFVADQLRLTGQE